MDQEKVKAFLQKIGEDQEFQARMEKAKSPEECLGVVQEYGFQFEMDEFKSLMQVVLVKAKQNTGQELTDEELALVAGGGLFDSPDTGVVGIVSIVIVAVGAASAAI